MPFMNFMVASGCKGATAKGRLKKKIGRSLFTWEGVFFAYFVARHFVTTWKASAPP
jgi:hypothetical protein